jgi:hypothetical protein
MMLGFELKDGLPAIEVGIFGDAVGVGVALALGDGVTLGLAVGLALGVAVGLALGVGVGMMLRPAIKIEAHIAATTSAATIK